MPYATEEMPLNATEFAMLLTLRRLKRVFFFLEICTVIHSSTPPPPPAWIVIPHQFRRRLRLLLTHAVCRMLYELVDSSLQHVCVIPWRTTCQSQLRVSSHITPVSSRVESPRSQVELNHPGLPICSQSRDACIRFLRHLWGATHQGPGEGGEKEDRRRCLPQRRQRWVAVSISKTDEYMWWYMES